MKTNYSFMKVMQCALVERCQYFTGISCPIHQVLRVFVLKMEAAGYLKLLKIIYRTTCSEFRRWHLMKIELRGAYCVEHPTNIEGYFQSKNDFPFRFCKNQNFFYTVGAFKCAQNFPARYSWEDTTESIRNTKILKIRCCFPPSPSLAWLEDGGNWGERGRLAERRRCWADGGGKSVSIFLLT